MIRFSQIGAALLASVALVGCNGGQWNQVFRSGPAATDTPSAALQPLRDGTVPIQAGDSYYVSAAASVQSRADGVALGQAKNVILFIGDGMGVSTVTAGRIHAGQLQGRDGESHRLAMETLPWSAFSKTYSHDAQVSDSAATATAMVAGVKAPARTLGLRQGITYNECASASGQGTDSLFELAERAGMSTGLVSTARLTHATPASAYAEAVNRNWENDAELPDDVETAACPDIARQFIDWPEGDHFEIALAGGRAHFLDASMADPEAADDTGARSDGTNLAEAWAAKSSDHVTVFDAASFTEAARDPNARILGLFEPSHMKYELHRADDASGEPSLEDMTRAAITRLSSDEDGYFLMVEAGRIDHGHHGVSAIRALTDTVEFDEAIAAALDMTSSDDTLIIVTADHSHTLTIQGYQPRNTPILGKIAYPDGELARLPDGKPYTTLTYANGPSACGFAENPPCPREDITDVDTTAPEYRQQALLPLPSETHAGEDVPVYAIGPGAELVRGTIEQNELFHIMGYASGLVAR